MVHVTRVANGGTFQRSHPFSHLADQCHFVRNLPVHAGRTLNHGYNVIYRRIDKAVFINHQLNTAHLFDGRNSCQVGFGYLWGVVMLRPRHESFNSGVTVARCCTTHGCQTGVTGCQEDWVTFKATHTGYGVDTDLTGVLVIVRKRRLHQFTDLLQLEHRFLRLLTSRDVVVQPFSCNRTFYFWTFVNHQRWGNDTTRLTNLFDVTEEGGFIFYSVTTSLLDQLLHCRIFEGVHAALSYFSSDVLQRVLIRELKLK
ncbi:hypothetical protein D3C80_1291460 [compost metagenome]